MATSRHECGVTLASQRKVTSASQRKSHISQCARLHDLTAILRDSGALLHVMSINTLPQDAGKNRKRVRNREYYYRNKSVGRILQSRAELTLIAQMQKPTEDDKEKKEANRARSRGCWKMSGTRWVSISHLINTVVGIDFIGQTQVFCIDGPAYYMGRTNRYIISSIFIHAPYPTHQ